MEKYTSIHISFLHNLPDKLHYTNEPDYNVNWSQVTQAKSTA